MTEPVPRSLHEHDFKHLDEKISALDRVLTDKNEAVKELLASKINAVEDAAKLALEAADKAATKADNAFEKRMDTTNEWRGALEDAQKRLATIQMVETLKETVEKNEKKIDALLNKVIGFGALTVVISIIAIGAAVFGR